MASYKVPQDVEAEDKLLGPFSFRQFIYLIIAVLGIALAWGLGQIFVGLAILPLPIILFFGVMALPLRKDQPMETYMTAVVRFWMKPRVRLWQPEGDIVQVEITAPKTPEVMLTKGFSGSEAERQLSYLAQVVDTGGWASRGVVSSDSSISDIVTAESNSIQDMFDTHDSVMQNFNTLIDKSTQQNKQAIMQRVQDSLNTPPVASPLPAQQTMSTPAPVITPHPPTLDVTTPIVVAQPQPTPVVSTQTSPVAT